MPYEISNPPDRISELPKKAQKIWISAFNSAIEDNDEESANRIAWSAVKKKYKKEGDNWVKKGGEQVSNSNNMDEPKKSYYTVKMDETVGGEVPDESDIQVMPVGKWEHPSYGEIQIEPNDIDKFKEHFEKKIRNDIPVTAGHAKPGEEKPAVGWIQQLKNKGSDGLWAIVEWTEKGKELLKDKAFKYFSPEFHDKYEDPETHETYENVLVGGALTNKPYFKELEEISLSEVVSVFNSKTMEEENKQEEEEAEEPEEEEVEEEEEEEEEAEEAEEVEASEPEEEEEVDASESIQINAAEYKALKSKAEQGHQAKKELEERKLSELVDKFTLSEDGGVFKPKAKDKVKEFARGLSDDQLKKFEEILKGVPEPKMFDELGDDGDEEASPQKELDSKVEKKMSEDSSLEYADAVREVTRENPDLAKRLS